MTDMTLEAAIAELRDYGEGDYPYTLAVDIILRAVASGDIIPASDARLAVAQAYQKAADGLVNAFLHMQAVCAKEIVAVTPYDPLQGFYEKEVVWSAVGDAKTAILALAPEDAPAEVRALKERAKAARWNVDESGNLVRLCRGDHEKGETCGDHEEVFVPVARIEAAEAEVARLREALERIGGVRGPYGYSFPEANPDYGSFAVMPAREAIAALTKGPASD